MYVLEEHSHYARTAIFNVFYLPNHRPSSVWTAQAGRAPVSVPFGKKICLPGGSVGASCRPPGEQKPSSGQTPPWLCRPQRCCFPWHQRHTEIQSRKAVKLFGFVHEAVFSLACTSYCLSPELCIKEVVLISCLHIQTYFSYLLARACSDHKKIETGCRVL